MDNNEVALELLKLFLAGAQAPVAGAAPQEPPAPVPPQQSGDSLFDFKQPLSASDKDG